jgi:hypothetical protein
MAVSSLPVVWITCRNGHDFDTRAKGGTTVRCKTCRIPKMVPRNRPPARRGKAQFDMRTRPSG